ncbi:hypothetical protein C8N24_4327 [Solirubrobacter pauli]|uniref:Uncharacterized protein n=1 Tax=Solirubrobacter pauli TaxID=166793 RepID=A0A660KX75_9ACTN|nr:hypothetical protein [Solirubrobacter pauli]RKQ86317.1 hypothetical protein C8N24_4327 [Solirubrobacter pauli]
MDDVVFSVEIGEQAAAVVRRPGGRLLFVQRGAGLGVVLDRSPSGLMIGGRLVAAGRVPETATGVTVIDAAGEEHEATLDGDAWFVVAGEAGFDEQLVRYRDAQGEIVGALPAGERFPVPDATDPCPVCAAVAWTQVAFTQDGHPGVIVGCERCGCTVGGVGGPPWLGPFGEERPRRTRRRKTPDDLLTSTVARASFAVYAPVGAPARVSRVSAAGEDPFDGPVTWVELVAEPAAGVVQVSSAAPDARRPTALASCLAAFATPTGEPGPQSPPGKLVRSRHAHRVRRRLALRAEEETRARSRSTAPPCPSASSRCPTAGPRGASTTASRSSCSGAGWTRRTSRSSVCAPPACPAERLLIPTGGPYRRPPPQDRIDGGSNTKRGNSCNALSARCRWPLR